MNQRGVSGVISVLIIIALTIGAISIVWVLLNKVTSEMSEQISVGSSKVDLKIEKLTIVPGGIVVRVEREIGEGELSDIKFVVNTGEGEQVFEKPTTMQELNSETFNLEYSGYVEEISIAPILVSESGKKFIGGVVDAKELNEVINEVSQKTCNIAGSASSTGIECAGINEDETDATIDECNDHPSDSPLMYVKDIILDKNRVWSGEDITATCVVKCYSSQTKWGIAYKKDSGSWVLKKTGSCSSSEIEEHAFTFSVESGEITQYIRCLEQNREISGTCANQHYSDNDDISFVVVNAE